LAHDPGCGANLQRAEAGTRGGEVREVGIGAEFLVCLGVALSVSASGC